jgi:hypothetical protein
LYLRLKDAGNGAEPLTERDTAGLATAKSLYSPIGLVSAFITEILIQFSVFFTDATIRHAFVQIIYFSERRLRTSLT